MREYINLTSGLMLSLFLKLHFNDETSQVRSSADFNFMGTASKYNECRSMQVNIHLKPHLDLSSGPKQSKLRPSNGLSGIGRCLLSYLTLWVACWQHNRHLFTYVLTCSHIFQNQKCLFIMFIVLDIS